jgi:hypothetical protein
MFERSVVATIVKFLRQNIRHFNHFGNFTGSISLVGQPQRLVVNVFVHVSLFLQVFNGIFATPSRPVVIQTPPLGRVRTDE